MRHLSACMEWTRSSWGAQGFLRAHQCLRGTVLFSALATSSTDPSNEERRASRLDGLLVRLLLLVLGVLLVLAHDGGLLFLMVWLQFVMVPSKLLGSRLQHCAAGVAVAGAAATGCCASKPNYSAPSAT